MQAVQANNIVAKFVGIKTINMEVELGPNQAQLSYKLPNMDTLAGMIITGIECYMNVGAAGGNPNVPANAVGIPVSPASGLGIINFTDLTNGALVLKDSDSVIILDSQPLIDMVPSLNYGLKFDFIAMFNKGIPNVSWSNSSLIFGNGTSRSAANLVAYFMVSYVDPRSISAFMQANKNL